MSMIDAIKAALAAHHCTLNRFGDLGMEVRCTCGELRVGGNFAAIEMFVRDGDAHQAAEILKAVNAVRLAGNTVTVDDGGRFWRAVYTDTESCSGVAPVCSQVHVIGGEHDVDGSGAAGDGFDAQGVYDCCPGPHIEAWSEGTAADLADSLNRHNIRLCT